jgi:hypothetical protein
MTKSIIELAREAHLFDDDQEPLVQHLELFAALHRASIIEELTGEMPEPSVIGKHKSSGLAETGYTLDQMREYAAGLVLKERERATQAAIDAIAFNSGTVQMEAHVRHAIRGNV